MEIVCLDLEGVLVPEIWIAGITKEVQKLEFLVRQSPASLNINSTNFRILFRNSIYNITGLIPLYDHNNYLKIESEIRKAGVSDDFR